MKVIRYIMSLFNGSKKYQVWDTSALSNHFERFKQTLKEQNVIVVIPEGVSHEISVGRRNNEICKDIYRFIEGNIRNPKLHVEVTPDSIRSWAVDEQVIYTASAYYNKGYEVKLITCDRDQCFRAKLKNIEAVLIPVARPKNECQTPKAEKIYAEVKAEVVPEVVKKPNPVVSDDMELPARFTGKDCWLSYDKNLSVYDRKGKRKIARPEGVMVTRNDMVYYNDVPYIIKAFGNNSVCVSRMH